MGKFLTQEQIDLIIKRSKSMRESARKSRSDSRVESSRSMELTKKFASNLKKYSKKPSK